MFSLESYLTRLHYWNTAFFSNYSTEKIFDQYLIKIYFNVDIINERIFNLNCITKISLYPAPSLDISNCDIASLQRNLILNSPEFNKQNLIKLIRKSYFNLRYKNFPLFNDIIWYFGYRYQNPPKKSVLKPIKI